MGYFSILPGIIIAVLVLGRFTGPLLQAHRPKWTRPFVTEQTMCPDVPSDDPKQRIGWVISLLAITAVGVMAELIKIIHTDPNMANGALLASWVWTPALVRETPADPF